MSNHNNNNQQHATPDASDTSPANKTDNNNDTPQERVITENSKSVGFRELPPIPKGAEKWGTILLTYQYVEPVWTPVEHKQALKKVMELGQAHGITGRGRVAPEGVNFTLSSPTPQALRDFCRSLRQWKPAVFDATDFKLTDFVPADKLFKSLSIRKTEELVAYGLAGDKAPSLEKFAGTHLEATDYHKALQDKNTVVIDVRNAYESAIGGFRPPPGGATLLDPKMRNSIEFPKWLSSPETQQQLNGKKVLMYCTGGIRCERATALLNQMSTVNPDQIQPEGVYHMRGGIERYVKTFPEGGYWKGKNYLFDRRREQTPGIKQADVVDTEITAATCCLCRQKWTAYRGKFKCSQSLCGVPVIVCPTCDAKALAHPERLTCDLCKQGYRGPDAAPDLVDLKRKAEALVQQQESGETKRAKLDNSHVTDTKKAPLHIHPDRVFISKLPLTVTKTSLEEALGAMIPVLQWLTDKETGAFYGSCIAQVTSPEVATRLCAKKAIDMGHTRKKRKFKIVPALERNGQVWPPENHVDSEFPPLGQ